MILAYIYFVCAILLAMTPLFSCYNIGPEQPIFKMCDVIFAESILNVNKNRLYKTVFIVGIIPKSILNTIPVYSIFYGNNQFKE